MWSFLGLKNAPILSFLRALKGSNGGGFWARKCSNRVVIFKALKCSNRVGLRALKCSNRAMGTICFISSSCWVYAQNSIGFHSCEMMSTVSHQNQCINTCILHTYSVPLANIRLYCFNAFMLIELDHRVIYIILSNSISLHK